ncbi:MAG TPA: PSD1 and planctomycete cytochrome C domain-containing protein [Bryobacteraceae bacterium]
MLIASTFAAQTKNESAPTASGPVSFSGDIAPIFRQSCAKCHSGDSAAGRLRLDSEAAILRGGASGPAVVPRNTGASLLIKRVLGLTEGPRMPMNSDPLPGNQVKLIQKWIDQGDFTEVEASAKTPSKAKTGESAQENSSSGTQSPLFATKVRPILASRCYSCHGPEVQQNGLRLDSLEDVLKGSESGKIIVPGRSDQSRIVRRLMAKERPLMPYGGPPLSNEEIDVIRQWIDAGAPGPDSSAPIAPSKPRKHWAYVKPARPATPDVKNAGWCRNPIDNFILSKLEQSGLRPSEEADKATLIRRVYLDVIGLPPSPQEVDAFLADKSPDAYEKVVDRLFRSPRYGEHWARQWLDLARYADSNGYEADRRRTAWEYRDWVIRALNKDVSFRDFTIEQIAGDMLPHPTHDQLIATGFSRNSMLNQEGGVDPEEYYWYSLVDRTNTTASVWLGLTLGCAQCHNHKFDPLTQKDYYRFLAFYSNSEYKEGPEGDRWAREPELELPTPDQETKSRELRGRIAELQKVLDTQTPQLDAAQKSWEAQMRAADRQWTTVVPDRYESAGGAAMKRLPDGSILTAGKNPQADTYVLEARINSQSITGMRIEVLGDPSLPNGGPGRDPEGNFFLSKFEVQSAPAGDPDRKQLVKWKDAAADESQEGYNIKRIAQGGSNRDEDRVRGWAIDASTHSPRREAVFVPDKPFGFPGGTVLTITLKHEMRHASRNIGHFRLSITTDQDPEFVVRIPARLRPLLDVPAQKRTSEQAGELAAAHRSVAPLLEPHRKQIAKLQDDLEKLGIDAAMIMRERPGYARPTAYIRERGTFTSKGELVYADVPSVLGPLPKNVMPNRLGLADWLVSDDNPLTARVTVNHFWEAIFGHGIVETAEDFGSQGELPSHPELLDWLATEFEQRGWSMKAIQRLMVTSATYRQSSHVTPELLARDPYNKLYARGPRFRVEAEMVHDIALSASGLLSAKMYGPSVFPYQPEGILDLPYNDEKWIESRGEDRYRRAIYTMIHRSAPYPSLSTFDAPSRETCTVRRVRTNTPLQALTVLNDPYFFDAARAMAKRMLSEGGTSPQERATYGFRLAVSRRPKQSELDQILSFYNQQLAAYQLNPQAAAKTLDAKPTDTSNAPELAAWTMVANVLLNMDETISKD